MSKETIPPQFGNLKEAYCGTRRCRPEKFVRKVFWRTLNRAAIFPALFAGSRRAESYQKDLETISAIGEARSVEEFERALEEFFSLNLLERDFWRGSLGLRVSGVRLANLFRPLLRRLRPLDNPSASATQLPEAPRTDGTQPTEAGPPPSPQGGESLIAALRKLRRVHELVVAGTLFDVAARDVGLDAARLEALLDANAVGRPELAWLQGYVQQMRELETLRHDNARLSRLVADLTVQLNQNAAGLRQVA